MDRLNALRGIVPGVFLALVLAVVAKVVSQQIGALWLQSTTSPVSAVLCAVLVGILWRNIVGVGCRTEQGVEWVTGTLLRIGIALVGLRLTFEGLASVAGVGHDGDRPEHLTVANAPSWLAANRRGVDHCGGSGSLQRLSYLVSRLEADTRGPFASREHSLSLAEVCPANGRFTSFGRIERNFHRALRRSS